MYHRIKQIANDSLKFEMQKGIKFFKSLLKFLNVNQIKSLSSVEYFEQSNISLGDKIGKLATTCEFIIQHSALERVSCG